MGTTTIRIDTKPHAQLVEMSQSMDISLIATVREAAEALSRRRFAGELDRLRKSGESWTGYLSEAEPTSVNDGRD